MAVLIFCFFVKGYFLFKKLTLPKKTVKLILAVAFAVALSYSPSLSQTLFKQKKKRQRHRPPRFFHSGKFFKAF
jgi:hypothetical protein